ncbi:DUF5988 family protein [Micromonospora sp. CA-263727]|uniref:DUF5988 family protein n=1 Tax=Micromonospora sp. CA-263727 TaxID=3239967 RepID=UPI003D8F2F65
MRHSGDDGLVDVVLEGGPADLPPESRLVKAVKSDEKIKIEHHGGYEHFERVDGVLAGNGDSITYRWTTRTRIAE